ncbi:DUF3015 domain-containing protein [Kistimonas scapharcae]|uniref:DUF3015 domain-containing protein n=1 Tax=Kistimonas scapharcae TaxID=1036133 RepID=A0ABP8V7N2_9GAMM
MKKIVLTAALVAASSSVMAAAPGGPSCGWGNMLFEGQSGTPTHVIAYTTNGTSGNATFGMTSGTNGCQTSAPLTYRGQKMINVSYMMDELSEDMARGNGEALNAVAVMIGIEQDDRARFASVTHENFNQIFPSADVTAEQVVNNLAVVMNNDEQLSKYIAS